MSQVLGSKLWGASLRPNLLVLNLEPWGVRNRGAAFASAIAIIVPTVWPNTTCFIIYLHFLFIIY